jgi:hypothetical protein
VDEKMSDFYKATMQPTHAAMSQSEFPGDNPWSKKAKKKYGKNLGRGKSEQTFSDPMSPDEKEVLKRQKEQAKKEKKMNAKEAIDSVLEGNSIKDVIEKVSVYYDPRYRKGIRFACPRDSVNEATGAITTSAYTMYSTPRTKTFSLRLNLEGLKENMEKNEVSIEELKKLLSKGPRVKLTEKLLSLSWD